MSDRSRGDGGSRSQTGRQDGEEKIKLHGGIETRQKGMMRLSSAWKRRGCNRSGRGMRETRAGLEKKDMMEIQFTLYNCLGRG